MVKIMVRMILYEFFLLFFSKQFLHWIQKSPVFWRNESHPGSLRLGSRCHKNRSKPNHCSWPLHNWKVFYPRHFIWCTLKSNLGTDWKIFCMPSDHRVQVLPSTFTGKVICLTSTFYGFFYSSVFWNIFRLMIKLPSLGQTEMVWSIHLRLQILHAINVHLNGFQILVKLSPRTCCLCKRLPMVHYPLSWKRQLL